MRLFLVSQVPCSTPAGEQTFTRSMYFAKKGEATEQLKSWKGTRRAETMGCTLKEIQSKDGWRDGLLKELNKVAKELDALKAKAGAQ